MIRLFCIRCGPLVVHMLEIDKDRGAMSLFDTCVCFFRTIIQQFAFILCLNKSYKMLDALVFRFIRLGNTDAQGTLPVL